ncbi:hypothetical protein BDV96DRAFT_386604 [Lophiotrema nucula]|uniref:Uncharacterized protein n=1 Tax=Lophiotrema nucula TaxID=690887 RepID=A0A6A5ZI05_9PLEO|nr:hypothetical protein BDV96DRAFT_386604 [Lophiotrema nucula]
MPFLEGNEARVEATPEVISANRPPQLNETVCGCRCGCGCSGLLEGDGGDGGSTSTRETTLFDPDEEDPQSSDGPEAHVTPDMFAVRQALPWMVGDTREVPTRYGSFDYDNDGFRPSQRVIGIEDQPLRPISDVRYSEISENDDSMVNGTASDTHSVITPNVRSIRPMSPGPGLGHWIGDTVHSENYFLAKPLRLTPQRRFCRGLVASHLVVRDDAPRTGRAENFFHDSSASGPFFR